MPDDADLYSDSGPTTTAEVPAEAETSAEVSEGPETALLPKSFFPDEPAVGKVCQVRVEQVMEDQVSVSYNKSESGYEEGGAPPAEAAAAPDEEMQGYMA